MLGKLEGSRSASLAEVLELKRIPRLEIPAACASQGVHELLGVQQRPRHGKPPEKQIVGTVTASHKMLTLQALSSSFNAGTAKRGCLGRGKVFVPQTGSVHLHIIDKNQTPRVH